jgi:LacI family transcriptional regulator
LQASHRPCVLVGYDPDYPKLPWVDVDNVTGAKSMLEHLIGLGHQRIATIAGPQSNVAGRDRLRRYRLALAEAGMACDEALVSYGDYTEESGYYAAQRLLPAGPTAMFCASDSMAIGAIKALTQAGRRVPEDVSVGGYDDAPAATLVTPPLTTVQQSVIDLGKTATEKLISLLENHSAHTQTQLLSTRLIVRQSTRAV